MKMNFYEVIKYQCHKLTPLEMATRELVVAEIALLEDMTDEEAAHASVAFNQARIKRLRATVNEMTKSKRKEAVE